MISHKHKFILISPQKTGTTSVTSCLLKYADYHYINKQGPTFDYIDEFCDMQPWLKRYGSKHIKLRVVKQNLLNRNIDYFEYLKIGMIRNPYDRVVSAWRYGFNNRRKKFKDYLKGLFESSKYEKRNLNMCDFFKVGGDIEIDLYIKYENIQRDFNNVCEKIGVIDQQLPHKNKGGHKHYSQYYDKETISIVSDIYAEDINTFKYKFESWDT
jgi:hypothetical protein